MALGVNEKSSASVYAALFEVDQVQFSLMGQIVMHKRTTERTRSNHHTNRHIYMPGTYISILLIVKGGDLPLTPLLILNELFFNEENKWETCCPR